MEVPGRWVSQGSTASHEPACTGKVHLRKLGDSSELRAQVLKVAQHGCDHA